MAQQHRIAVWVRHWIDGMTLAKPSLRTRLLVALAGVAAVGAVYELRPYIAPKGTLLLEGKVEGCLPWEAYWYDRQTSERQAASTWRRHDLILFPARGMMPVIADGQPIGKMVAGVAGDEIRIEAGNVYINGVLCADVRYGAAKLNKPLNYWDTRYRLKDDELFVFGSERHSWDSRYWGPYPAHLVRGRIRPVF